MRVLMRPILKSFATALLSGAWLLSVPSANAQAPQPPQSPNLARPSPDIPEQKLDQTAAALASVARLKSKYEDQLATAPATDHPRIVEEANGAMEKAVTDQGLTVEEYTSIMQIARNDTGIREKILQRLDPLHKQ